MPALSAESHGDVLPSAEVPKHLWRIHGKHYDMSDFVSSHPGGEEFIMVGKGRDCTELFESVHALANKNVAAILSKYEVKDVAPEKDMFSWEENGFYRTLQRRVRAYFAHGQPAGVIGNYKATLLFWAKVGVMAAIWAYLVVYGVIIEGCWWKALLAGFFTEAVGFNMMHDGSHGAISKGATLNRVGMYWGNLALWDEWLWLTHHVYGHHSYTGVNRRDPDLNNAKAFLRKHPEGRWKSILRYQHLYVWLVLMVFPNQHIGQCLQYVIGAYRKRLFGVPLVHERPLKYSKLIYLSWCTLSLSAFLVLPMYLHGFWTGFICNWCVWMAAGSTYFMTVAPNHDSPESAIHNVPRPKAGERVDWGEQQVRCSGNHSTETSNPVNWLVTHVFGGMNFQIEHHLFPSVNNVHFPAISKIVKDTAREFDIPYNCKPTWFAAMKSYYTLLRQMGRKEHSE